MVKNVDLSDISNCNLKMFQVYMYVAKYKETWFLPQCSMWVV